jgi:hypothetical protein
MTLINYYENNLRVRGNRKDLFAFLRKIIATRLREWF